MFPPNIVTHHSNPQKTILVRKHVVSIKREIGPAIRPGRGSRKKVRTGQDRTGQSKKTQGGNVLPICGETPTVPIETKICMAGNLADIITCAKFVNGTILHTFRLVTMAQYMLDLNKLRHGPGLTPRFAQ